MATVIDGKKLSLAVKDRVAAETAALKEKGIVPGLAVILVGEDPASQVYVRNKKLACEYCGFRSFSYNLPADTSLEELLQLIDRLNKDPEVDGILIQQPFPKQIPVEPVTSAVDPSKDVDAFHPVNIGRIMQGNILFPPCTPAGVMEMLSSIGCDLSGKECVVVGRSNIVGKPMAMLLLHANATVTICHSRTKDLASVCRRADVLISAVGKRNIITADMVKPGAVVIDVGMNRNEQGKLCGDVDYPAVSEVASAITPVPGGVGPMTISMLMQNTLIAARLHHGLND